MYRNRPTATCIRSSLQVFDVDVVGVVTAVMRDSLKLPRLKPTNGVIPDFPQLEAETINSAQRPPESEQFFGLFVVSSSTRVEFDHQLLDVGQASRTGQYRVERRPFGAFDVYLQNVNRCLCNNS